MHTAFSRILETLEGLYGPQYSKGWESLRKSIGFEAGQLLAAPLPQLMRALSPGGMVPEIRARRLKEVAARAMDECGGDLGRALACSAPIARKLVKKFPDIADPGADRILLFAGIAAVAAVPSNCPHVIVRIMRGRERQNYAATYKEAQQEIERLPESIAARTRAFLLLKRHGQDPCKRAKPKCGECPVRDSCAFNLGRYRGWPGVSE